MEFSEGYTAVWESNATPGEETDDTGSVATTRTEATGQVPGSNEQVNGPLTAAVEVSGWTQDDIMLAAQLVNILLFLLVIYETVKEDA